MRALFGLAIGLILSLTMAAWIGEDPLHVLMVLIKSGLGSGDDIAMSLFYATSMMFTGLGVAISFRAGLFNIGAEGQLNFAALVSTVFVLAVFGVATPVDMELKTSVGSGLLHLIFVTALAFGAGAIWGGIVGLLKAYRGSHEVVLTMMMNFIAMGLLSYFVVGPFQSANSQNPETELIPRSFQFSSWDPLNTLFPDTSLNISLLIALGLCVFFWWFYKKTRLGFEWQVTGADAQVAEASGIDVKKTMFLVLAVSGGIAGMVVMNDVFGAAGKLRFGFSPEYGFVGVAVALLARNHPLGIIPSALLFGILQKGAADLDMETEFINRDFAKIIQATIILSVLASGVLPTLGTWMRRKLSKT